MRHRLGTMALFLMGLSTAAWAHGADELGHHWDMPVYRSEMLTQILLMAGVSALVFGGLLLAQARRRGRKSQ